MVNDELSSRLAKAFARYSDHTALEIGADTYTYADLWSRAMAFSAEHAATAGAIGILPQRCIEAYVAALAAVVMGRPYVSLNMKFPLERQVHIARESDCRVIVADAATEARRAEVLAQLGPRGAVVDAEGGVAPAYYMFTSGTTGAPKGVVVTRANLEAYLATIHEVIGLPEGMRCTQLFDLSFDVSVHDMFYTWSTGGALCPMTAEESGDYVGFANSRRIQCWYSVPSVIAVADRSGGLKAGALPHLRYCLFAGEALPTSLAMRWMRACPQARGFNLYGPTEGTITITGAAFDLASLERSKRATVPIGLVNPGGEVALMDDDGRLARRGAAGELWIGGPQVASGYANNVAETNKRFVEASFPGFASTRWYRTGDLVEPTKVGYVYLGRIDDQVKIRGYRVELFEIEEVLRAASGVQDVAAVPWPISETGAAEAIVAFVASSGRPADDILDACRRRLPIYMTPSQLIEVDQLPLNQNGKVDRKALRLQHLEGKPARRSKGQRSIDDLERELVHAWSRQFPGKAITPATTFVSLHGDSLSYVNTLLASEQVVGSLPDDWMDTPISSLARASAHESSMAWVRVDTPAMIRALAILVVLAGHHAFFGFDTGAVGPLMLLSGYIFGASQLSRLEDGGSVWPMLRPLTSIAAIYYLFFLPLSWAVLGPPELADVLLLQDLHGEQSYLWYVHALIHILLVLVILGALVRALGKATKVTLHIPLILIGASLALGLVTYALMPTMHPANAQYWHFSFAGQMMIFGGGMVMGYPLPSSMRLAALATVMAGLAWAITQGFVAPAVTTVLALGALTFVKNLRLPRPLVRATYLVAEASLFMYLLQPIVVQLLEPMDMGRSAKLVAAIAAGLAVSWAWNARSKLNLRQFGLVRQSTGPAPTS